MEHTDTQKAVIVKDLVKAFGSFFAVNHISFEVDKGMIYGFLGPNGAGKSTTIRMLCGILAPTSGYGRVAGFDIYTDAEKIKRNIGYMSQKFSLYDDLTVNENINFYSGIYNVPEDLKATRKAWTIQMAGLENHLYSKTATLSAGWKQRLALGCAILHNPSILFLDEPTAGVDPINRRRFWNLIYELASQGITVFVTTHYMDEAEYFDRIGFIYQGKLIANGAPEELKRQAIKQAVVDITCDRPEEAIFLLQRLPCVKDAILFEDRLHLVVDNFQANLGHIQEKMKEKEISIWKMNQVVPSVEDLFIALTEQYDQQARV